MRALLALVAFASPAAADEVHARFFEMGGEGRFVEASWCDVRHPERAVGWYGCLSYAVGKQGESNIAIDSAEWGLRFRASDSVWFTTGAGGSLLGLFVDGVGCVVMHPRTSGEPMEKKDECDKIVVPVGALAAASANFAVDRALISVSARYSVAAPSSFMNANGPRGASLSIGAGFRF